MAPAAIAAVSLAVAVVALTAVVAWRVYENTHSALWELPIVVAGLTALSYVLQLKLFFLVFDKMKNHVVWVLGLTIVAVVTALVVYTVRHLATREPYVRNSDLDGIVAELYAAFPAAKSLNFYEGNKSYTLNKKDVYICMKDEHGDYYDRNFLVFVILHEISHALCDEIGHTDKFMRIFHDVVARAAALGLYDPDAPKVVNYCNYSKENFSL